MFQLSNEEWQELITNCDKLPKGVKFSPSNPFAFTEQGVAMLSSVLNSEKAIEVNIAIIRAFVYIRQYALNHLELSDKLKKLEIKYDEHREAATK
jgi:hypothetical protein